MANRDARVCAYVTEDTKNDLKRLADSEDMSLSDYLRKIIDRQMVMEAEDEISAQTRATERLQRLVDNETTEMRSIADDVKDMNAKTGAYAIAAFELMASDASQTEVQDALSTGAKRLREGDDPKDVADEYESADNADGDNGGASDPFAHRK